MRQLTRLSVRFRPIADIDEAAVVCHVWRVTRWNIFFIALGIAAASLVVAYKVWTQGVEKDVRCSKGGCSSE